MLHYNGLWAQLRLVAPNISWLFMMTPISQNLTRAYCLLPLPAWIRNGDAVGKHQQLIISRVQFLFRSILLIIKIVSSTFKDVRRGVGKILGNLMPQKWSGFVRGSAARSLHNTQTAHNLERLPSRSCTKRTPPQSQNCCCNCSVWTDGEEKCL